MWNLHKLGKYDRKLNFKQENICFCPWKENFLPKFTAGSIVIHTIFIWKEKKEAKQETILKCKYSSVWLVNFKSKNIFKYYF